MEDPTPNAPDWYTMTTREAIAALAGNGVPQLTKKVRECTEQLTACETPIPMLGASYDVAGAEVDVARYLSGDPECMVDFFSPFGTLRTLHVYVSTMVSGSISTDEIIQRGAAIAAHIDKLESQGVRVKLTAVSYGTDNGEPRHTITIGIKDYQAPLDIDLVAFVITSPAFHRRLIMGFRYATTGIDSLTPARYTCPDPSAVLVPEMRLGNPIMEQVREAFQEHA
jgi:hypothetical protein